MSATGVELCRASIAHHSKSFAMAARLLPGRTADDAAIVYAWCRRADDAVDSSPPAEQPAALARLRAELSQVYADEPLDDAELEEFRRVVRRCRIPETYPLELLEGMAMDCRGTRYSTGDELLSYCYRVAGVVGLMMCHVMGLRDTKALRQATHLGIAMQLTNICRDVLEDWDMGRLYLPDDLLREVGLAGLMDRLGEPFPCTAREPVAEVVRMLLDAADRYYRSGDQGLRALDWRSALAVRSARLIYAEIGRRVEAQGCDVTRGRVYVSKPRKLQLVARAAVSSLIEWPRRLFDRLPAVDLDSQRALRFPQDVLPL